MEFGLEAVDVRVDLRPPGGDDQRQALVSVLHEIAVIDLDQRDGLVDHARVGGTLADRGPESLRLRSEAGVEVVDSPDGADDVRHLHLPATDREARPEVQPAADILE